MVLYVTLIIALVNDFFFLLPVSLPFKLRDVALGLIILGLVWRIFLTRDDLSKFSNVFTALLVAFLLMVLAHVALAAFYYGQSVKDGLIYSRTYFYYLSFFLILLLFKDIKQYITLFNVLSVICVFIFAAALLDYNGIKMFYGQFSDNTSFRGGVERGEVTGMDVFSMVFLWQMSVWAYATNPRQVWWARWLTLLFFVVHIFRQGRFRLFSILVGGIGLLVVQRKVKTLIAILALSSIAVWTFSYYTGANLLREMFVSGTEDAINQTGTADDRVEQLEIGMKIFNEHPILGSGTSVLRVDRNDPAENYFKDIARVQDLGYAHWLKHFGMLGICWLIVFFASIFVNMRRAKRVLPGQYHYIYTFIASYLTYLAVSFITLNHFMFPTGIIQVSLFCALVVQATKTNKVVDEHG